MKKSNRVISLADVDFCLREIDNLYDDDNNDNLDTDRNKVYLNSRKLNFKGKSREFDSPTLFIFIYDII